VRLLIAALLLTAGCDEVFSLDRVDAGVVDALPDAGDGDGSPLVCFGGSASGGVFEHCLPTMSLSQRLLGPSIDTGGPTAGDCDEVVRQKDQDATEVCVIAGSRIEIVAGVRAIGARPLVLIAVTDLVIGGELDASSRRNFALAGAGANHTSCTVRTGTSGSSTTAGGGGGGGGAYGSAAAGAATGSAQAARRPRRGPRSASCAVAARVATAGAARRVRTRAVAGDDRGEPSTCSRAAA